MPLALEYYGNQGLIVKFKGTLNTDRYGLDSAIAIWSCPMDRFWLAPELGTPHPIWSYLTMEKRRVDINAGFAEITGEYVGITGGSTPSLFECSYGEVEEPIQTHPDFISQIAGTPAVPKNGAIFVDFATNKLTTDNNRGVFLEFSPYVNGARNIFGGVTSYLSPQATMRETWISQQPASGGGLGHISTPPFAVFVSGNWLFTGVSFQQRGSIFVNTKEWRSSGREGWNPTIYG